jgi:hypothetical protein
MVMVANASRRVNPEAPRGAGKGEAALALSGEG